MWASIKQQEEDPDLVTGGFREYYSLQVMQREIKKFADIYIYSEPPLRPSSSGQSDDTTALCGDSYWLIGVSLLQCGFKHTTRSLGQRLFRVSLLRSENNVACQRHRQALPPKLPPVPLT